MPATPSQPKSSFRLIFLLLLVAALGSAGVTAYILFGNKLPLLAPDQNTPLTQTQVENPFQDEVTNPFVDETASVNSDFANPFADENPDNAFTQFETESSTSTQSSVENPF